MRSILLLLSATQTAARPRPLDGKVAAVTGGSKGLGRARRPRGERVARTRCERDANATRLDAKKERSRGERGRRDRRAARRRGRRPSCACATHSVDRAASLARRTRRRDANASAANTGRRRRRSSRSCWRRAAPWWRARATRRRSASSRAARPSTRTSGRRTGGARSSTRSPGRAGPKTAPWRCRWCVERAGP